MSDQQEQAQQAALDYWCHQCNRTVSIVDSDEVLCPICHSGFVEQHPAAHRQQAQGIFINEHQGNPRRGHRLLARAAIGMLFHNPQDDFLNLVERARQHGENPGQQTLSFADLIPQTIVIHSSQHPLPHNTEMFMDYEQFIQMLSAELELSGKVGTPPASSSAIESLPTIEFTEEMRSGERSELSMCAVCKDDFEVGTPVREMPCKHLYHGDCLLPWLEQHNSCPVCRFELPTDDSDYEARKRNGGASDGDASTSSNSAPSSEQPGVLRRLIQPGSSSSSSTGRRLSSSSTSVSSASWIPSRRRSAEEAPQEGRNTRRRLFRFFRRSSRDRENVDRND